MVRIENLDVERREEEEEKELIDSTKPMEHTDEEEKVGIPLGVVVSEGVNPDRKPGLIERVICSCFSLALRLVLCASAGSFLFGINVSNLNTSLSTISAEFQWCPIPADRQCSSSVVMRAFASTSVFIGAAVGAMSAGHFLFLGRRMLIIADMLVFVIGTISTVVATSFSALFWGRLITGYGVGVVSLIVPIYMSEMSPPNVRGSYGVLHQLFITIGVFIGVLLGLPLEPVPVSTDTNYMTWTPRTFDKVWWRVMLGIGLIPAVIVIFFVGFVFNFETPHYYVERGKRHVAEKLLRALHKKDDVIQDLEEIIKAREAATKSKEEGITFWIAMKIPVYRNVLIIGCLLAAFQQFIGINVFVAASNKLFEDAGLNKELVTAMSTVLQFVNVIMTIPAIYLIESLGRKSLLIGGNAVMGLGTLPAAICFWINRDAIYTTWLAIAGAIVFIMAFAVSYGPVLWVILFEIFPIDIKGLATGLCTSVNWCCAVIMVFIANFIPAYINYTIFTLMSFIAVGISFFLVRETKGRTLEASPYLYDKHGKLIVIQKPSIKKD